MLSSAPITQKVLVSSPNGIKWLLFSTLSSAVDKLIFLKLTSQSNLRTTSKPFSGNFVFTKFFLQMLAKLYKRLGSIEIKTQIAVLKFQCSPFHHNTNQKYNEDWIQTTRAEPNGLPFNFLNQSANLSKKDSNKLFACMKTFN